MLGEVFILTWKAQQEPFPFQEIDNDFLMLPKDCLGPEWEKVNVSIQLNQKINVM